MCQRKHPIRTPRSLARPLLCSGLQEIEENCECSSVHHADQPPLYWLHLQFPLPQESSHHNQGPFICQSYSPFPSPVRQKVHGQWYDQNEWNTKQRFLLYFSKHNNKTATKPILFYRRHKELQMLGGILSKAKCWRNSVGYQDVPLPPFL